MAGRPKNGIDFSLWSVHIFDDDPKIDKLLDSKGWGGFGIYFWLCQRALGTNGYFFEWSYDDCASTARKMGGGINSGTVKETVSYCLQIDLFNKRLFDRWGVLTSRGIQRSFLPVLVKRRVKKVYEEYWLLNSEESKGLIKVSLNGDVQPTNDDVQPANDDLRPIKESKVKSKDIYTFPAELENAFQMYLLVRIHNYGEILPEQVQALRDDLMQLSDNDKERIAIVKKATAGGWKNFYRLKKDKPKEQEKPAGQKKDKFNNFQGRDYDMNDLERQIQEAQMREMEGEKDG